MRSPCQGNRIPKRRRCLPWRCTSRALSTYAAGYVQRKHVPHIYALQMSVCLNMITTKTPTLPAAPCPGLWTIRVAMHGELGTRQATIGVNFGGPKDIVGVKGPWRNQGNGRSQVPTELDILRISRHTQEAVAISVAVVFDYSNPWEVQECRRKVYSALCCFIQAKT